MPAPKKKPVVLKSPPTVKPMAADHLDRWSGSYYIGPQYFKNGKNIEDFENKREQALRNAGKPVNYEEVQDRAKRGAYSKDEFGYTRKERNDIRRATGSSPDTLEYVKNPNSSAPKYSRNRSNPLKGK